MLQFDIGGSPKALVGNLYFYRSDSRISENGADFFVSGEQGRRRFSFGASFRERLFKVLTGTTCRF